MPKPASARSLVVQLMDGYLATQLLYVAARLGVADLLAAGPRSADEVAAAARADPATLRRVLRGLVINGLLDEDPAGRFRLTDAGRYLQSDGEHSLRGAILSRGELYYEAASGLLRATASGEAPFRHTHGAAFFDYLAAVPERLSAFQESMVARSRVEASEILRAFDFSPFHHIVDVGGGFGVTLAAILDEHPHVRGTLFDRPEVIRAAEVRAEAAHLADRLTLVAGDAFAAVPRGGDLYLLSRVIHDWNDEDAVRILETCRAAMDKDTRILLFEAVIADRAADQPAAVWMDLHMFVLGLGKERTRQEFAALLANAGFALERVVPAQGQTGINILEASCV